MSTREILRRENRREDDKAEERERRRQLRIEKHQHALATVASRRRVLRLPEVEAVTGLKHSAIYEAIAAGTFPAPIGLAWAGAAAAEAELELNRVRGAFQEVLTRAGVVGGRVDEAERAAALIRALPELEKLDRYERRAFSKRKRALLNL